MDPITVTCGTACTVTLVLTPASATAEQYTAVNELFVALLIALAAIWGVKKIQAQFSKQSEA